MTGKKKKDNRSLQIGGNVNVTGGDFVAGDKNIKVGDSGVYVGGDVRGSNIVTGNHDQVGNGESARADLFNEIIKKIDQRTDTTPEDKEDLKADIEEIKAEANKGEQAEETFLSCRIRNLERIAPDIADVVLVAIASPAAGFAMVVKKMAERARKQATGET